ncbi:MAG: pilus assembly protein N-terminal domain-containing protein [Pirellulales bacterium]|nr:pilus assembly protein N-terminal domain-containing protein [Pirellulales bacterium]
MIEHQVLRRVFAPLAVACILAASLRAQTNAISLPLNNNASLNFEVKLPHERMEMTASTSRILTMAQKIPQAQVNNPDLLDLTPLSPTQIQVSAKKAGVTQINLWDEEKKLYTIDVIVYGDAQELTLLLKSQFPNCSLKIVPVASSVLISGYVDKAEHVDKIIQIAQEFYPKVINNMTLGGVQTVLLHVKLMEVSRTKLRRCGMDWSNVSGGGTITSTVGDIASSVSEPATFTFSLISGGDTFAAVLDCLRQDNLLKILAEPKLVTQSGRAASFNSGGEIPVPVPQSLGTVTIEWKKYGAQVDFVPIVLGNGKIRLEVRPRVSELDTARSITIQGTLIPGIRSRDADTAVELTAGQTLAIAGLVSSREEGENKGLPWISEVPYLGVPFRRVKSTTNEVELLILVTPELVGPMDASEVPPCGPGMSTTSPTDWELYMKGHLEVPNCCPNGDPNAPPDGMIGPEEMSAPSASGAMTPVNRANFRANSGAGTVQTVQRANGPTSQTRYNSSKPNPVAADSRANGANPPSPFVGPVGYDVIK